MKTAEQVTKIIEDLKAQGVDPQRIAWEASLACVGWAYVFGARGQYCTPANRRARYSDDHPTIKTKCKNYNGSGSAGCSGCKWYPESKYTRIFDCRGFTYWILKQVYGWELMGAGATSQWNTVANWKAKGKVAEGIPADTLVCLFVRNGKTMEHTGFGFNEETIECSSGVQHFTTRKAKWTDWGVPACIGGEVPVPTPGPAPAPERSTLRRGSKGTAVVECQTMLDKLGYDLGQLGIDGDYGRMTQAAVMNFQSDHGLGRDGICGPKTWEALIAAAGTFVPAKKILFTVIVPHLTEAQAEELIKKYDGAISTAEGDV